MGRFDFCSKLKMDFLKIINLQKFSGRNRRFFWLFRLEQFSVEILDRACEEFAALLYFRLRLTIETETKCLELEIFRRPLPFPVGHCKFQHDQTICLDLQRDFCSLDILLSIWTIWASSWGFWPLAQLHCHPHLKVS